MATKVKQMPHNMEAEQSVLGCIMISDSANIDIFSKLNKNDFYSESHRTLFEIMYNLYTKNSPIDLVTVMDGLEQKGLLDSIGGMQYLSLICNLLPSAANYKHYVEMVKRDSILRQLINASQDIINLCYDDCDYQEAILKAESLIYNIALKTENSKLVHIKEALPSVMEKLNLLATDKNAIKGLLSGFYGLDSITNGFQNSDLILVAARPSVGKTSFAMNVMQYIALKSNKYCAIFSLEMSKEQLAQRSLCSLAKVDMEKTLKGEINKEAWKKLTIANDKLFESHIYVDDSSFTNPTEILNKCRKLKRERGLDFVVIDYLQLMSSGQKNVESRQNEVSAMSRMFKIMARDLNIPVMLLSQLSRAVEKRTDHRPILSDLRESGAIEQDADIVMFLHKPSMYSENANADKEEAELIIAKHRNGRLDNVKLRWLGQYTSFVDTGKNADLSSLEQSMPNKTNTVIHDDEKNKLEQQDVPFDISDDNISDETVINDNMSAENAKENYENKGYNYKNSKQDNLINDNLKHNNTLNKDKINEKNASNFSSQDETYEKLKKDKDNKIKIREDEDFENLIKNQPKDEEIVSINIDELNEIDKKKEIASNKKINNKKYTNSNVIIDNKKNIDEKSNFSKTVSKGDDEILTCEEDLDIFN